MELKTKAECMACPTKIWQNINGKYKKNDEYHEVDMRLDNNTVMTIGVCAKHQQIDLSDLPHINQKLQQGWLEEVALGIADEAWVKDKANNLTVIGVNR